MLGIIPINDLTNLIAIMDICDDDKNTIIQQLNRYANVAAAAQQVVSAKCTEIIEAWEENYQEWDDRLVDSEEDALVGLAAMFGEDNPLPANYIAQGEEGEPQDAN